MRKIMLGLVAAGLSVLAFGTLGCSSSSNSNSQDASAGGAGGSANTDARADSNDGAAESAADASDAQSEADSGCTADLSNDPQNCGACGNVCQPATCAKGLCAVTTIATAQNAPQFLAVNSTNVYWSTTTTGVQYCPKTGCAGSPQSLSSDTNPQVIVATDTTVYWAGHDQSSILSCPAAGCSGASKVEVAVPGKPISVVIDQTNFYWTAEDATVGVCPRTGCASGSTTLMSGLTFPVGIATYQSIVFVADKASGQIVSCPASGCSNTPTVIADGQGTPIALAVANGILYWSNQTDGSVASCPVSGCPDAGPAYLAAALTDPTGIQVDSNYVYVGAYGSAGEVLRCQLAGSPHCLPIAKNQAGSLMVAIDDSFVYWTDVGSNGGSSTDGTIQRVSK